MDRYDLFKLQPTLQGISINGTDAEFERELERLGIVENDDGTFDDAE